MTNTNVDLSFPQIGRCFPFFVSVLNIFQYSDYEYSESALQYVAAHHSIPALQMQSPVKS